ncbi:hypothetical protein COEREDRAFT_92927 [Coemansia reversa NRRL 1564]|uniref:U three protein 23 n=1 Tax=Coemansia reversa (strain ATCC 12441 / NRRL 1564) TaxID=763665 RepID=A0A2G5BA97_COERN|nr:hypothetical protein COEREDRAFT_92927 [Coemansia reversa NRRL 1564]|eukprot:PIA15935.1 hypothetical protein COEREDRAFT_92927 [Coemansia reversa NRRL 1564]
MRPKRAKAYKKAMQFYQQSFGFRDPYQILVSPDFVLEGVAKNIKIADALKEVVGNKVRLLISFCGICDVRKDSEYKDQAITITREFEKRRCTHKDPIAGTSCISEIMGSSNEHHYCVAAQDSALRAKLRSIPGVPIIHIKQNVVVLEPASEKSQSAGKELMQGKLGPSTLESQMLKTLKEETRDQTKRNPLKRKKKKGPKGPNPLSVKKTKKAHVAPKKSKNLTSTGTQNNSGVVVDAKST